MWADLLIFLYSLERPVPLLWFMHSSLEKTDGRVKAVFALQSEERPWTFSENLPCPGHSQCEIRREASSLRVGPELIHCRSILAEQHFSAQVLKVTSRDLRCGGNRKAYRIPSPGFLFATGSQPTLHQFYLHFSSSLNAAPSAF